MNANKTLWWMLQLQFPYRPASQRELFVSQIPRPELIRKAFSLIPQSIRITRGASKWGLAQLQQISHDLWTFQLTVRPPNARIAEEPEPGHLEEIKDPICFTNCVFYIPAQIIVVQRYSDVSRFARSANTFANIFFSLLDRAIQHLQMDCFYTVEVEPIAEVGSFLKWFEGIDELKKIAIKYTGPNLPVEPKELIYQLRDAANQYQAAMHSTDVELVANNPDLDNSEIKELDLAASRRKIKLIARGTKSGIGTSWSSATKPIPEAIKMTISDEQLDNIEFVANKVEEYIRNRFNKVQIEE